MTYELLIGLRIAFLAAAVLATVALILRCLTSRFRRSTYRLSPARALVSGFFAIAFLLSLGWDFGYGRGFTFAGCSRGALILGVRDELPPGAGWFWHDAAPGPFLAGLPEFRRIGPYPGVATPFGSSRTGSAASSPFFGVVIPLWVPVLAFCVAPLMARIRPEPRSDECSRCGYNLTGNVSGRCPECGTRRRLEPIRTAPKRRSSCAEPDRKEPLRG